MDRVGVPARTSGEGHRKLKWRERSPWKFCQCDRSVSLFSFLLNVLTRTSGATGVAKVSNILHVNFDRGGQTLGEDRAVRDLARGSIIFVEQEDVLGGNVADLGSLVGSGQQVSGGDHELGARVLELVDNLVDSVRVVDGGDDTSCAQGTENWDTKVVLKR